MRTLEELLQLLRNRIKNNLCTGMCWEITDLYSSGEINSNELTVLIAFLNKNEPSKYEDRWYWFKSGEKQPRLNWIDEQLKKLKQ